MSRRPLRAIAPELDAAETELNTNRTIYQQRKATLDAAKTTLANLSSSATATKPQLEAALLAVQTARPAAQTAKDDYDLALDRFNGKVVERHSRRMYLQKFKNDRDPLHQLDAFPEACHTTLGTVVAYQLTELNLALAQVPSGTRFWRYAQTTIDTTDADMRELIIMKKEDLQIRFKRWVKDPTVLAALYERLTAEGFTATRDLRT